MTLAELRDRLNGLIEMYGEHTPVKTGSDSELFSIYEVEYYEEDEAVVIVIED